MFPKIEPKRTGFWHLFVGGRAFENRRCRLSANVLKVRTANLGVERIELPVFPLFAGPSQVALTGPSGVAQHLTAPSPHWVFAPGAAIPEG